MSTSGEDIERALPAAAVGDAAALAVLWRAHQHRLLRYLSVRGVGDAEDVATQVWIDVARNLRRFRGDAEDFRRWLFTIAHRRFVDERRRTGRNNAALTFRDAGDATAPGADVELDERDSLARALDLVAGLPTPMRDVILLRVVADLSVADTADVLGLRPGNVRVLMHRGLRTLERRLATQGRDVVTLPSGSTMNRSK